MARILVVDDEAALLRAIERYLKALGHDVAVASNGREALACIDSGHPDVLITDINMPDMDGIEILHELHRRESALPVIAMSGGGQFDRRLLLGSARVMGALLTLEKPFTLESLGSTLAQVLES